MLSVRPDESDEAAQIMVDDELVPVQGVQQAWRVVARYAAEDASEPLCSQNSTATLEQVVSRLRQIGSSKLPHAASLW